MADKESRFFDKKEKCTSFPKQNYKSPLILL